MIEQAPKSLLTFAGVLVVIEGATLAVDIFADWDILDVIQVAGAFYIALFVLTAVVAFLWPYVRGLWREEEQKPWWL